MRKQLFSVLLVALVALTVTACNSSSSNDPNSNDMTGTTLMTRVTGTVGSADGGSGVIQLTTGVKLNVTRSTSWRAGAGHLMSVQDVANSLAMGKTVRVDSEATRQADGSDNAVWIEADEEVR